VSEERRIKGGERPTLDFENNRKTVFIVSSRKSHVSPLLTPLEKFCENSPVAPPWKKSFQWLLPGKNPFSGSYLEKILPTPMKEVFTL